MSYLKERGWVPCLDSSHSHCKAGTGEVLHPPNCENPNGIYAPARLITYDDALLEGFVE